jgi:hypothetical protein
MAALSKATDVAQSLGWSSSPGVKMVSRGAPLSRGFSLLAIGGVYGVPRSQPFHA